MRDAAGQLPHRLHLEHLAKLILGLLARVALDQHPGERGGGAVPLGRDRGDLLAILAQRHDRDQDDREQAEQQPGNEPARVGARARGDGVEVRADVVARDRLVRADLGHQVAAAVGADDAQRALMVAGTLRGDAGGELRELGVDQRPQLAGGVADAPIGIMVELAERDVDRPAPRFIRLQIGA